MLLPFLYKSLLAETVRRDFSFWSSSSETEKREAIPFFPSYEVSCLKAGLIVDTYYQVCLL